VRARIIGGERGQVTPVAAIMLCLIGFAALHLGNLGEAANHRAQAQTAADAAALAGVAEGEAAARSLAKENRGRLLSFREIDSDVLVEVQVGEVKAKARARGSADLGGGLGGGGGRGSTTGLAPAMRAALARAEALIGRPIPVVSGFRSRSEQAALWARRGSNPYPVAPPGSSMHERGLAVDVPRSYVPLLARMGRQAGLCQPYPRNDPIHFELCR
jgi:hypothetical protein